LANFNSQKRKNTMAKQKSGTTFTPNPQAQEDFYVRMRLPNREEGEMFALITQLMGSNQIKAICEDGVERQLRIPGKLKKKVWIRENDMVIAKLWEFQKSKGDIVWRYLGNQVEWLKRNGKLNGMQI
jgi:translation initiation factor 1A